MRGYDPDEGQYHLHLQFIKAHNLLEVHLLFVKIRDKHVHFQDEINTDRTLVMTGSQMKIGYVLFILIE